MADRRIRVSSEKVGFLKSLLKDEEEGKGPFRLQVDVLAFSAVLGARRNRISPLKDPSRDPIRKEVFDRQGYDTLINLLAIYNTEDPNILADTDDMEDRRASIFEEYANGGLELLEEELKGMVDYVDRLLLFIGDEEEAKASDTDGVFDLSSLLDGIQGSLSG